MRATPAQDIDVEPVRLGQEQVWFVAHEREALEEPDAHAPVRHHLRQRERRRLHVHAALDDLEVWRHRPEVLVGCLVCEVAEAEGLGDLSWGEELLELQRWSAWRKRGERQMYVPWRGYQMLDPVYEGRRLLGLGTPSW